MSPDDRDQDMEQRLREALAATADSVQPGGDGLMRIQQRIGVRRNRERWFRPALALGSVVVIAAAVIGGVAIARSGNNGVAKVTTGHSPNGTPTAHPVSNAGFPSQAFFPFTTAAEEANWEQEYAGGHSPWVSDPTAVTESWVSAYLKQAGKFSYSAETRGATSDVTVSRGIGGSDHPVTIAHLTKFHHAWLVTGASSAQGDLVIANPAPGATGNSPLTVSGPGFGVDERAAVEVRDAETPSLLGQAETGMFGNGTQQWSATVSFSPSNDGFGVIVVSIASPADGGVGEFTAQKVVFTQASPAPNAGGFYGVQAGVIEQFDASGKPQGPVPGSDAYGTVAEVKQVAGTLYFTTGSANCAYELRSMSVSGGTSSVLASVGGYSITGFDVAADGRVVYFESGCGNNAGSGNLVMQTSSTTEHVVAFPSLPPAIVGDPVWEADGIHVDAFVRTGMQGYLARYHSSKGSSGQGTATCSHFDVNNGLPNALTTAPDGALWFAVQTGTSIDVLSCVNNAPTHWLTVPVNGTPTSLAVDSSGNILLVDANGEVWRGAAGQTATKLATQGGVSSVTW